MLKCQRLNHGHLWVLRNLFCKPEKMGYMSAYILKEGNNTDEFDKIIGMFDALIAN